MTSAKKIVEVAVIIAVIAVIWGLMSLPIMFYYLPGQQSASDNNNYSGDGSTPQLSCTPTEYVYTGEVCKDTILALKQCIINQPPRDSEDVRINISRSAVIDSEISEWLSTIGIQYIQTLAPSQECVAELVPFLCQYLFTPCDERGVAYYPSSEDCVYIRDQVCAREWEEITRIPTVADYLPNCESLPVDSLCNIDLTLTVTNGSTDSTNVSSPLMCSEGYIYIEEVHQCRPHCPSWELQEHGFSIAYNVLFATTAVVSVLASIVVLFLSSMRYKRMLTFPSVLIVYQVISILILESTFLIGFTDREALFCSSQDWLEVLNSRGTPFCTFSGIVFHYITLQLFLWWLFHISAVFCGVKFPLHVHSLRNSSRVKYAHIGLVIAGVLIPVIPVIAMASVAGSIPTNLPPIYCVSASTAAIFYGIVFPSCFLLAVGMSLLVCIVWLVIKDYCHSNRSEGTGTGTVIVKLLILFSYFTLFFAMALSVLAVNLRNAPSFFEALFLYFLCKGDPASIECDRNSFQQYTITPFTLATYILLSFYPLTCLIYAVNITELKDYISVACLKFKKKLSMIRPTAQQVNNQLQPQALESHTTVTSN